MKVKRRMVSGEGEQGREEGQVRRVGEHSRLSFLRAQVCQGNLDEFRLSTLRGV